jgi:mRNA interferase MazF
MKPTGTSDYVKDFNDWNEIKKTTDKIIPKKLFNEREVWWCAVGVNVGFEQDGKGEEFTRPVLVVKKFNEQLFFGAPLTSQDKKGFYYHKLGKLDGERLSVVMLSQARVFSANRLRDKIYKVTPAAFGEVNAGLNKVLLKIFPSRKPKGAVPSGNLYPKYNKSVGESQALSVIPRARGVKK